MKTEAETPPDFPRPAFPKERAKKLTTKKAIWLIALFGTMVIMLLAGLVAGIMGYMDGRAGHGFNDGSSPWIFAAFVFLACGATFLWTIKYWKAIDEMAKRAHLDAFYWGGSIAWLVILPVTTLVLVFEEFRLDIVEGLATSSTHAFGLGVAFAIGATCVGYSLFWLIWWAKRR